MMNPVSEPACLLSAVGRSPDRPYFYEFRLEGPLDSKWSDWFDGLSLRVEGGETVLTGWVPDQSALYGLLERIRDLGMPLLSVVRQKK